MNTRLEKVKHELVKKNLDAILVSSTPNITYLTGYANFSNVQREAFLLITKTEQFVITDGRYSEAVAIHIPHITLIERTVTNSLDAIFKMLRKKYTIKRLGIEEDNLSVSEYKRLIKYYNNTYHYSIDSFRAIKEKSEIDTIEKACQLADKTFSFILNKIKKGMSERELAFAIEMFVKKNGAELSFPTIVAFGKNSSIPHHQTGNTKLDTRNTIVLLDFGVKLNNYCSDMTRTVFFGSANAEFKKMYNTVFEAQQKAIQQLNNIAMKQSSVKASEVDSVARTYIEQQGYPTIPHSLGHGIGLEVHESPRLGPRSKDELKEGMVFSIEPGIYLPGVGGVRVEDLVVLKESSTRLLTKSPREIIEV